MLFNGYEKQLKLKWDREYNVIHQLIKEIKVDEKSGDKSIVDWEKVLSVLPYFNIDIKSVV